MQASVFIAGRALFSIKTRNGQQVEKEKTMRQESMGDINMRQELQQYRAAEWDQQSL